MNPRSPWTALLLAAVVAGAVVAIDRVAPEPAPAPGPAAAPAATDPVAGSWVCPVGDGSDGTSLQTVVARPTAQGAGPASIDVATVQEGDLTSESLPPLFPPSHAREVIEADGEDIAAWVRWNGAPATVFREWEWDGADDLPDATVAGPCAQPFSSEWIVPGMSTVGGHEARLRLANPFRTDATIAVHFVTSEGIRAPIALQNWTVPAQTVREINVNEVLPEIDDLSAVVEVATGRLSVEGYQITRAAIGGVDGGSLLAAAPSAAETWTVPWIADGEQVSSWLWVVNTGERTAPVELTLHTPDGGDVPEGLAELTVPPGELRRVDLSGTLPEGFDEAAVTVRSDGAPVVVSAAIRQTSPAVDEPDEVEPADPDDPDVDDPDVDDPDAADPALDELDADEGAAGTGFAVQLGVPDLDRAWTVSGGATNGRQEHLHLVNPSGTAANVDVVLFHGTTVLEPEELQGIEVSAGTASSVEVTEHLGDVDAWTAFVTASEGELIVGRVGAADADALRLIAVPGTPSAAAVPEGELLAGMETPGFVHRMGTSLGLRDADPFDDPSPPPAGDPPAPDAEDLLDPSGVEEDGPSLDDPEDGLDGPDPDPEADADGADDPDMSDEDVGSEGVDDG